MAARLGSAAWAARCARASQLSTRALSRRATPEAGDELPVVNVSSFLSCGDGDSGEAARLHAACRDVGFFYLAGHGVPEALMTDLRVAAERFFAQDHDAKMRSATPSGFRGYQWLGQNVTLGRRDRHEAFDLQRELAPGHRLLAPGWPEAHLSPHERALAATLLAERNPPMGHPPELEPLVDEYVERMLAVGAATVRAMATGLADAGWEGGDLVALTNDPWWIMRLIHYPPTEGVDGGGGGGSGDGGGGGDGAVAAVDCGNDDAHGDGCGEHTDYGLLTLIGVQTPGIRALEVRDVRGAWVAADPPPGCFVCNIGDMMARFTRGLYVSTPHRVLTHPMLGRVSAPFFYEPAFDAAVREGGGMYGEHLLGKLATNLAPAEGAE